MTPQAAALIAATFIVGAVSGFAFVLTVGRAMRRVV